MRNRFTDPASRLWIKHPKVRVIDRYGVKHLKDLCKVSEDDREVSCPKLPTQKSIRVRNKVSQIRVTLEKILQVMPVKVIGRPEDYL